jgi:hypothetical protein
VGQRSLTLHLLQAPLSFQCFRDLGQVLRDRSRGEPECRVRNLSGQHR